MSWLLPVRDGAAWLGGAVRSALNQCSDEDEIIVVDDGSVDGPQAVLPPDPRVRLVSQPAAGIVAALERGRALARGEFIARLDADDLALPGRIPAQLAAMGSRPRLAVVGGRARLLAQGGGEGMRRYVEWVNGLDDLHRCLLVESPIFHPAALLRASAVQQVGGYRHGDFPEDYDLWLRLAARGWGLANLPREVVQLRDRPERLTRTDPRYRPAAFRRLKMDWLAAGRLAHPRRVVVWGAGRGGRPWIRWLLAQGHDVPMVIDSFVHTRRQGVETRPPQALAHTGLDLLLVAVGARGARALIRDELARVRPDLVEGRGWFAVA